MNAKWKGGGTRWNSSGGLEEHGRRMCRYVVGSAPEYFRAGENVRGIENVRGMEVQCDCTNLLREGGHP